MILLSIFITLAIPLYGTLAKWAWDNYKRAQKDQSKPEPTSSEAQNTQI